jgi:hypothetical protein
MATTLTGTWQSSESTVGTYYIRQAEGPDGEQHIWWNGSEPGNDQWNNVAFGTIEGQKIEVQWADLPSGKNLRNGTLTLELSNDSNTLTVVDSTGGFGSSKFTRQ